VLVGKRIADPEAPLLLSAHTLTRSRRPSHPEQDQHTFRDDDGTTYLIWKTDDNSVGANTTRLWGQRLLVAAHNVSLLGEKHLLLESDGLWWVTSWVAGGSLIEGPEIIKHGDYCKWSPRT
jgi:hypothetical protein